MADTAEARDAGAPDSNVTELVSKQRPGVATATDARLDARAALELRAHIASGYAAFIITTEPIKAPLFSPDRMMRLEAAFAALGIATEARP